MDPLRVPLLNEAELQELINNEIAKVEEIRRDPTRKYHEQIAELELAFREKLHQIHLHTSSTQTQHELLQAKLSMNLQQGSSRFLDSVLLERPGWCSPCEVDCNTRKDLKKGKKHKSKNRRRRKHKSKLKMLKQDSGFLEQPGQCSLCEVKCTSEKDLEIHISGKKHQSKLKTLKQESGEGNSKQVKPQAEHEKQEGDIIGNPDKREKQMKEGCISLENHKTSSNSSQISTKCADVDGRKLECSDRGSLELKIVLESKDDGDLVTNSNEDDLKESAEIIEIYEEEHGNPDGKD